MKWFATSWTDSSSFKTLLNGICLGKLIKNYTIFRRDAPIQPRREQTALHVKIFNFCFIPLLGSQKTIRDSISTKQSSYPLNHQPALRESRGCWHHGKPEQQEHCKPETDDQRASYYRLYARECNQSIQPMVFILDGCSLHVAHA